MNKSYIDYQRQFDVRCEWGAEAIEFLYDTTDIFIIVDVLSFTTCVEIATSKKASILPYRHKDESAKSYAEIHKAILAARREEQGEFSLSPSSMLNAREGQRIVLPSPNGAILSMLTRGKTTFAGCLRNAKAIANMAQTIGGSITIVAAGERWPNGNIRFALEDALGCGAIISAMIGKLSPEAEAVQLLFEQMKSRLGSVLEGCISGNELINREFQKDITLASELNISINVPILRGGIEYIHLDT